MTSVMCRDIRESSKGRPEEDFTRKDLERCIAPLVGFDRVHVLVRPAPDALAERKERRKVWESYIAAWNKKVCPKLPVQIFYDLYSTRQGPCADWWRNICLAFQDKEVQRVDYFHVDIVDLDPPGTAISQLQKFIDKANAQLYDLLLGNEEFFTLADANPGFEPFLVPKSVASKDGPRERIDIRKNRLEAFAVLLLQALFPGTFAEFVRLRNDPNHAPSVRTGVFSLSRRLFEAFRAERGTMLPYGGTIQLLLCALIRSRFGSQAFDVGEHFVGRIKTKAEDPTGYGFEHQLSRIEFVLRNEHAYYCRKYLELQL